MRQTKVVGLVVLWAFVLGVYLFWLGVRPEKPGAPAAKGWSNERIICFILGGVLLLATLPAVLFALTMLPGFLTHRH